MYIVRKLEFQCGTACLMTPGVHENAEDTRQLLEAELGIVQKPCDDNMKS
jgi:hypothetical protein